MADVARISTSLALIIKRTGRQDVLFIKRCGDGSEAPAGGPHVKDTAHHGSALFINNKMMLIRRVALVAVGRICSHEFAVLRTGPLDCLDLLGGIPAVKFIKQVQKAHNIGTAIVAFRVNTVIQCNEAAAQRGKQIIRILTELDVVPSEAGQVFHQDEVNTFGFCVLNELFDRRMIEIRSGIAIITVSSIFIPAHLTHIVL